MNPEDPHPQSLDALAQSQEHAHAIREACEQLLGHFRELRTPSSVEVVALTASEPFKRLEAGTAALSITLYNPSPSIVYMGYAGGSAKPEARPWSLPPSSMLTLSVPGEDLEFGAEAAQLALGDVVFFVLRHKQVMDPFFGGV
jgi:hypothetical protein